MLFTLRPLVLESQAGAALEQLAEKMRTRTASKSRSRRSRTSRCTRHARAGVLFYIIEEAVNNARHAQAQQITVRLSKHDAYVLVEVEDNGVGFDVDEVTAGYDRRGSLGLINMRERAELIEGNLRIQSAPGHGTRISVMIPLRAGTLDNPAAPPLELRGRRARDRAARNS